MPAGDTYDREWTVRIGATARRRMGLSTDRGVVTRFVLQLEYLHDGDWRPVVRYDHDAEGTGETAHDVTEEGLHIDIYRDGEQLRTEYVAPTMPAGVALDFAEDHLAQNLERYLERYERWHGIRNQ